MKKVLKLKLEPGVHDKFRSWAFNHRVTMQGELENYVGGLVDAGAPSVEAVERHAKEVSESKAKGIRTPPKPATDPKQATVEPLPVKETQNVPVSRFYGAGVVDDAVFKHQCALCRLYFPEHEMVYHAKTMKWACKECVDNQKNGQ